MAAEKQKSGHTTLYHHTDRDSATKILDSGKIRQSQAQSRNDDARYGDGTYLTKVGPNAPRNDVARNNYDGKTSYWESKTGKTDVAIEVTVPNSKVENHSTSDRSVYKYKGDLNLNDAKNVKVHVRTGKDSYQTYNAK